ncbi:amino acid adenylation domain-containing protein [Micromonospora sp. RTGN7]|uniref:amino acid adenylation domain-containing protein n=1 Tax=Micromonospora sp. RTGN7 TaxID=3016526 RepID=UPI0029FEF20F|nr:amino acid adenylation domain-containing protein [Micromonospora sp. RTGN7]
METATRPASPEPVAVPVCDLVRAQARSGGERDALVDLVDGATTTLSYAALVERVDDLAARLRAAGTVPEQPVVVLLGRSADTIVAMLAVLEAGGVYCPLDPAVPPARTGAMVRDLGARVAIADGENASRLPGGVQVVDPAGTGPGRTGAPVQPHPDSLAYILHTSGSTGRPKGVAMTHRGLARLIRWQLADGPTGLRTLQFTATSFDVTFQEVLSTLATGGCLVIASEQVRRDPAAMLQAIVRHRIERLFLPYVALQLLAVAAARASVVPDSLRHVVTAGERLIITPAIRALFAAIPGCRLDNHYGPTEAHLVTSRTLPGGAQDWPAVPSIGVPVDGVVCRVLDDRLQEVAPGDTGELYVAGSCLARGYHGKPALTAERFVAAPSGDRLYRTGDLVRAGGDGTYEFVGRADSQLKVRGFRVEPAEVENALLSHPRVEAAGVGLREVADGVPALVGYVQAAGEVSPRELSDHLRGLLPAYMIPARYLMVASMPRTGTGKIDTRALGELELSAAPDAVPAAPAAGMPLPELITSIWARVLGHDDFEPDDDFFDVGGDSLLASWVVAELRQVLGRPVELSVLLEDSTVEDLAAALEATATVAAQPDRSSQIVTLRPGPSGRSLYLLHPLGGELIGYRELAHAFRAPARLLGVGWAGEPPRFGSSLSEIAAVHVEQLRLIQRGTPFLLAGWSFGGVLAYEIAQQLTAAGEEVEFLGLLDANPVIDPITGLPMAQTPFLSMLDAVLDKLGDSDGAGLAELTTSDTWIQLMGAPIPDGASGEHLRTALQTARACMHAAMEYQPRPFGGPVTLFQAAGGVSAEGPEPVAALRGLCVGGLTVRPVAGDHWGLIRGEHVTGTATELDAALERTGAAGSVNDGS